jgi:ribosome-associated protein
LDQTPITVEAIDLARHIVDMIADKKGEDIVLMDIHGQTLIADYFVLCSGTSERQIKAIIDGIRETIKKDYNKIPQNVEGESISGWMLMDYGDVVVHVFSPESRVYYDLEGFWLGREAAVLVKIQ